MEDCSNISAPSSASVDSVLSKSARLSDLPAHCVLLGSRRIDATNSDAIKRLAGLYTAHVAAARADKGMPKSLWLSPHRLSAEHALQQLFTSGLDATLAPGIKTIARLSEALVSLDDRAPQVLPPVASRWLLQQTIHQASAAGEMDALASVIDRPGLVDTLDRMIGELKLRGIAAKRFTNWAKGKNRSPRDRELATLYTRYQDRLEAARSADRYDLPRLAVEAVARRPKPSATGEPDWQLVVVDGFTSLSHYERALLLRVFERAKQVVVSLDLDYQHRFSDDATPGVPPEELNHGAMSTLAWLRQIEPRFAVIQLETASAPANLDTSDPFALLSDRLFRTPRAGQPEPLPLTGNLPIEIVPATNAQNETIRVARKIKSMIALHGVRPSDIVIGSASLKSYQPRIEETFANYGIPVSIARPRPLGEAAEVATVAAILALAAENWPYRSLVATIGNSLLTKLDNAQAAHSSAASGAKWRTARGAAEWLIRDLQIASGRSAMIDTTRRLAESFATNPTTVRLREQAAAMALGPIERLAQATAALPTRATPLEWISACKALAAALGINLTPVPNAPWHEVRVAAAWVERIAAAGQSAASSNDNVASPTWSLEEWLAQLRDWCSWLSISSPMTEGCVQVLQAEVARYATAEHLFLMGLDEQSFAGASSSGAIYSPQQYDSLVAMSDSGSPPPAPEPYQQSMQLFRDLVCRPSKSLSLSFPALDANGQSAPPSPLLVELARLFGDALQSQLEATPEITALPPKTLPPASGRDWRLMAVDAAAEKDTDKLGSFLKSALAKHAGSGLSSALLMSHHRVRGESFGPYEGIVPGPAASAWLAQQFGHGHMWSTSQLESYAYCPYQFLLKHVLRVAAPGDLALETDYSRRGDLMHKALAELHMKIDSAMADEQVADVPAAEFYETFNHALDSVLEGFASFGIEGVLNELLAGQVRRWGERYQRQVESYNAETSEWQEPLKPTHFELRFGKASRHSADEEEAAASTDEPLIIDLGDEQLLICGRIDRVDVGRVGENIVLQVIDYKSASKFTMSDAEVADGRKLQPALYAMAAAQIIATPARPAYPLKTGYWVVQQQGFTAKTSRTLHSVEAGQVQPTEEWANIEQQTKQRLREIVAGVRFGDFPMYSADDKCTERCDFSHVCRVGQVRKLGKVWPPNDDPPENEGPPE